MRPKRRPQNRLAHELKRHLQSGVLLVFLPLLMGVLNFRGTPAKQPIAFNHHKHVVELGMECTECHQYAVTGVRATIPNLDICGPCHEEPQTDSPEEALVAQYIRDDESIPWQIVHWMPDHVYFSHRRHTAIAKIDCEQCHGPISEQDVPLSRPLRLLSMETCVECHEDSDASTDCVSCHK